MKAPTDPRAALALALLLAACGPSPAEKAADGAGEVKRREPTRVRTAAVAQREMVKILTTTTVVESEREIRIFPRVTGIVVEVHVEEGDEVAEGALLAVVDARESAAMLEEARVMLREAENAIETAALLRREAEARADNLKLAWDQAARDCERNAKAGLISENALDALRVTRDRAQSEHQSGVLAAERAVLEEKRADTSVQQARLVLERRELAHSYTRIVAPFDGVIAQRAIKIGDTVTSGEVLGTGTSAFILTDPVHLRAVIHRPQRELALFAPHGAFHSASGNGSPGHGGAPANGAGPHAAAEIRAHAEALPGEVFAGEIRLVSPSIDPSSGSFRVTIGFDQPEDLRGRWLLPGMLVRLEIVTDRHPDALVVPKRALRREGDVALLFVVRDGAARRIEVDEAFSDDESVEVIPRKGATLAASEPVIVVGNRDLEDGDEVTVSEDAPSSPADATRPDGETPSSDAASGDAASGASEG